MQKKRNIRFQLTPSDIIVGILCLLGMCVSLHFFIQNFNMSVQTDDQPIGVIYFKKNTAQRRLMSRNLWERIRVSAPIYNGDRIRTGDLSEAVIVLNDSTEISLYENTLVQIFGEGGNSLNFANGSISVVSGSNAKETGETLKITSGDKIFSLAENTSAVLSVPKETVESKKDTVIAVSSGEIFVKPVEEKKTTGNNTVRYEIIEAGTVAQYESREKTENNIDNKIENKTELQSESKSENNVITTKVVPVTPKTEKSSLNVLMPVPSYTVAQNKDEIKFVPFFWTDESDVRIEFSYSPSFSSIVNTEYLSSEAHKGSVSLDFVRDGEIIYWRVLPAKEKFNPQKNYATGKISVQSNEEKQKEMKKAVTSVFGDEKAAEITTKVEEKTKVIEKKEEIAMSDIKPAAQIRKSVDIKPAVEKKNTADEKNIQESKSYAPAQMDYTPSYTLKDIIAIEEKEGKIVAPVTTQKNEIAKLVETVKSGDVPSKTVQTVETKTEEIKPAETKVTEPKKTETKTAETKKPVTKKPETKVTVKKPEVTKPVVKTEVTKTDVTVTEPEVKITDSETSVTDSEIKVAAVKPEMDTESKKETVTVPVSENKTSEIAKLVETAKNTEIKSEEPEIVEPKTEEPKAPRLSMTKVSKNGEQEKIIENAPINSVPEIKTESKSEVKTTGTTGTNVTEPVKTTATEPVKTVPDIITKTPKLLSPVANRVFADDDFNDDEPSIVFKWAEVEEAQAYKFELLDSENKVIWSTTVRTNKLVLSDKIDLIAENGLYNWSVTAIKKVDGEVYSSKTASRKFNILIAPPEAVTNISSKNSITIE